MKGLKRLAACTAALVLCASTLSSNAGSFLQSEAADDGNDDWLHAVGSRLYDKDGNEVWLTGANWFGFNCGENCAHGLWSADIDDLLSTVADHGFNCLRIPISTELLVSWMEGTPNAVSSVSAGNDAPYYVINPDFLDESGVLKNSMEIFDVIMAKCKTYGIKVILDVHSPAAHNSGHNYNVWYYNEAAGSADTMAIMADGREVTTEMWQDTLVWIADKYSNDDTIIAYDLKNEPHGKGQEGTAAAKWDDSTDENNWAYAATECALAMLEKNPNALILIEGVEQSVRNDSFTWGQPDSESNPPYYAAWWGGNLRGVRDYPIDLGEYTNKVVYSPHDYGPSVYAQTWFNKDFTTQTLLDDYWYDTWAYIVEEDIAPLLIGEWGGHMDGAENQKWMTLLRDYMIDNHINHTFWCLNPNSGDTGGLLDSQFANWDAEKYGLVEPSLWQTTDTGLYISLDHERPLGVNGTGISVSEYYASYADTEGSNLNSAGKTDPLPIETTATEPVTETSTDPVSNAVYGDVDCNGAVEILDVITLCQALMGSATLSQEQAVNANCDLANEALNASDCLAIMKYLVKLIDTLPING